MRTLEVTRTPGGKYSFSAFQILDDARITASELKASDFGKKVRNTRKKWKKQRPTVAAGRAHLQSWRVGPGDGEQLEGAEGRGRGRGRKGRGKEKAPTRGAGRGSGQGNGKSVCRKRKGANYLSGDNSLTV